MYQYIPLLTIVIICLCLILQFFRIIGSSRKIIHCHFIICNISIFFHNDRICSVRLIYSITCIILRLDNGRTLIVAGFFGNIHKCLFDFYKPHVILARNFTPVYNSVFTDRENIFRVVNSYIIRIRILDTAVHSRHLPYNIITVADTAEYEETVALRISSHKRIFKFTVCYTVKTKFNFCKRRSFIIHSHTHDHGRIITCASFGVIVFYLYIGISNLCVCVSRIVKGNFIFFCRFFITLGSACLHNKIFSVRHIFKYEESILVSWNCHDRSKRVVLFIQTHAYIFQCCAVTARDLTNDRRLVSWFNFREFRFADVTWDKLKFNNIIKRNGNIISRYFRNFISSFIFLISCQWLSLLDSIFSALNTAELYKAVIIGNSSIWRFSFAALEQPELSSAYRFIKIGNDLTHYKGRILCWIRIGVIDLTLIWFVFLHIFIIVEIY